MRRRQFIELLGGAAVVPLLLPRAGRAQQSAQKILRVGTAQIIPRENRPQWAAFEQGLRAAGYVEGNNLAIEYLRADSNLASHRDATRELVRRKVDIIVATGPEIALQSALAETASVPIVMIAIDYDPVTKGYIQSLARPGGNVTGLVALQVELTRKRLQLLKDAVPGVRAITVLWDELSADQWRVAQEVGTALNLRLFGVELRNPPYDYEAALASAPSEYRGVVYPLSSPVMFPDRVRLPDTLLKQKVVSMLPFREYAVSGGLFSYGASLPSMFARSADYVARIAKGAKPADMPVEQPIKFEFLINLRTAKALDLNIPSGVLAIADEVVE